MPAAHPHRRRIRPDLTPWERSHMVAVTAVGALPQQWPAHRTAHDPHKGVTVNTLARRRMLSTAAVASISALALAGCASGDSGDGAASADEEITLTITTFGTFGYDELYEEYEELNPNITIEATNIDTGGNARTDAFTKMSAGSGLSDIVAIEEGWLGAIMDVSDTFVDLREHGIEERKGDWVDWKYAQA